MISESPIDTDGIASLEVLDHQVSGNGFHH